MRAFGLSRCIWLSVFQAARAYVKLITFDFYAALVELRSSVIDQTFATLKGQLKSKGEAVELVREWTSHYSGLKDMNGMLHVEGPGYPLPKDPFRAVLETGLELALKEGLSEPLEVSEDTKEKLLLGWTHLAARKGTATALQDLKKKGYLLGILSNGSDDLLVPAVEETFGTGTFDFIMGSSAVGFFKPEPALYAQALQPPSRDTTTNNNQMRFSRDEILHVAGAGFDALGAKAFGFGHVIWARPEGSGESFANFLRADVLEPDAIVGDFSTLPQVVEQIQAEKKTKPMIASRSSKVLLGKRDEEEDNEDLDEEEVIFALSD
uniref:Haloacid dehalogenase-like hydrolase n=1 Tax=Chromera velia CCMP2878 TaxID=1169474 RepID=A0A0G4HV01_9ALVE|mmetsp:Transcript_2720/g.5628  ORF Transcript_2720/g.5628 Transcript_2720/m.5628 type:complete len:322 (-) Transcript_2720:344-1309(-)|eukprot:Cvel_32094.t1-p1 / transcript=Cvel_32094.t1 / gene=Cvel_32094 / organism=Chromera_velia_CCMP2878 / gene_product=(S)-2-haloacid dehalogenase H-109, putative / transcript_product=(S)-2-haloacid dehalogenase H-109, putative / location=Cvel_scaffold4909:844-2900(+) / protein_length=321 / sequence_SO=supercontig / SO=protein_coding / is_pseudo=false